MIYLGLYIDIKCLKKGYLYYLDCSDFSFFTIIAPAITNATNNKISINLS